MADIHKIHTCLLRYLGHFERSGQIGAISREPIKVSNLLSSGTTAPEFKAPCNSLDAENAIKHGLDAGTIEILPNGALGLTPKGRRLSTL